MKLRTFLYHLVKKSRGKEFIPRFDLYQLIFPDYYCFCAESKPKKELVKFLVRRGYDSDPVKAWKESQDKLQVSSHSVCVCVCVCVCVFLVDALYPTSGT